MNERTLVRIDFQNDFVAEEGNLTINNPALIARHKHFNQSLQKGMFTQIIDAADTHFAETYPNTKEAQPPTYGTKKKLMPFYSKTGGVKKFIFAVCFPIYA